MLSWQNVVGWFTNAIANPQVYVRDDGVLNTTINPRPGESTGNFNHAGPGYRGLHHGTDNSHSAPPGRPRTVGHRHNVGKGLEVFITAAGIRQEWRRPLAKLCPDGSLTEDTTLQLRRLNRQQSRFALP